MDSDIGALTIVSGHPTGSGTHLASRRDGFITIGYCIVDK